MKSFLGIWQLLLLALAVVGVLVTYGFTRNSANELFITAPIERGTFASYVRATGLRRFGPVHGGNRFWEKKIR